LDLATGLMLKRPMRHTWDQITLDKIRFISF